jgi:hypothetical protein
LYDFVFSPIQRGRCLVEQTMKLCLVLVGGLLLLGCAREPTEEAVELPADTAGSGPTISLADIAGTWNVRCVPESGDASAVTNSQIEITGEAWTLHLADRDPVEGEVTVSGDSILVVEGPYESVRRDGTMVTTHSVYRLEGDRLLGTVVARYPTGAADSVLVLRSEGTRAP